MSGQHIESIRPSVLIDGRTVPVEGWTGSEVMTNAMFSPDQQCVVCQTWFQKSASPRRLCCSGHDCGCYGECLDFDVCSDTCHEQKRAEDVSNER